MSLIEVPRPVAPAVQWTPMGTEIHNAAAGTLEHFLTGRYALYGFARATGVYRVRVHHPPWPLQPARIDRLTTTVLEAVGIASGDPVDLVLASASGVSVQNFAREGAN